MHLLFCSNLCIIQHRGAPVLGRNISRSLSSSATRRSDANASFNSVDAVEGEQADGPPTDKPAAKEADEEEEEEDMLIVLPPAIKDSERESRGQLSKLMQVDNGSGASFSRWESLRRTLREDANLKRKEDARNTGRYVEAEPVQLGLLADSMAEEMEAAEEEVRIRR